MLSILHPYLSAQALISYSIALTDTAAEVIATISSATPEAQLLHLKRLGTVKNFFTTALPDLVVGVAALCSKLQIQSSATLDLQKAVAPRFADLATALDTLLNQVGYPIFCYDFFEIHLHHG